MEVENKIIELLQPVPVPSTNVGPILSKKTHVTCFANFSIDTTYDAEKMNTLIAEEISRIPPKSRWRSLGKSYQWELICKYLDDQVQYDIESIPGIKEKLKRTLQNNIEIKVLFDQVNNKIQKICD